MPKEEMKNWLEESKKMLADASEKFYVFVDMRTLKPLPQDSQKHRKPGKYCINKGA